MNNNEINMMLGRHFLNECNYNLAISALTKAIESESDNACLYDLRGIAYGSIQEYEKSIADFNMAIELNAQLSCAYNNRALSYWSIDMLEKALMDIDKAIELSQDNDGSSKAVYYSNRGLIQYALCNFNDAVLDCSIAILYGCETWENLNCLGEAFASLGKYEEALKYFHYALDINPNGINIFANYLSVKNISGNCEF
ncbi:MAG: tetratricopeptide repeat protein [Dehalococcoidales bacterium]